MSRFEPPQACGEDEAGQPVDCGPDERDDHDLEAARSQAKTGTTTAQATISDRARAVVLVVIGVFVLAILVGIGASVVGYNMAVDVAVAQATRDRVDGAFQRQAEQAAADAAPANARLVAEGLVPYPIPTSDQAPAADIVNISAAARVVADMPKAAILAPDFRQVRPALDRFFAANPSTSQVGPTRARVATFVIQYMQIIAAQAQDVPVAPGVPPPPNILSSTLPVPPPRSMPSTGPR